MSHKIKSGSIVVNPSNLLQGSTQDHMEDRSTYLRSDEPITWTGTQLQFTQNIILEIIHSSTGVVTQHTILQANSPISLNNGESAYAIIDRTQTSENITVIRSSVTPIPAHAVANKDLIVLFRRVDAGGAGYMHIPLHKQVLEPGQTVRLGASGSGDGSGGNGDDLNALKFRASFRDAFSEGPTSPTTAVNSAITTATYDAASQLYRVSYDASKTATTTGTSATLSGTPAYTVVAGDMLRSGSYARRIVTVNTQTSYVLESAFPADLAAAPATVSQAVHTVDVLAFNQNGDGLAINSVISDNLSSFLMFYRDTTAAGDDVFDEGTTPVIAYTSSSDGSSYTTVNVRTTELTDTETSKTLPTASTNFYTRFFANVTSGTGAVNVLDYSVYLFEETVSTLGDALNQAFCNTDGSGTELNCSVGVAGGKTTVTLNFNYPVAAGYQSGLPTPQGALEVYLDGKLIPRYVDGTLTPDASFTEISDSVIQLDSDYSGLGLGLLVKRTIAVLDTTTTNTTNIAGLQQTFSKGGFDSFVDESATVAAPFTTIVNRARIPDPSQDLKVRIGSERILTQARLRLQGEYGPNGEPIWGITNDSRGLIRLGGAWENRIGSYGTGVSAQATNDFVEVTFYGTGLNILTETSGVIDYRVAVDGGAETASSFVPAGVSNIIGDRFYAQCTVFNLTSGLAQGLHTVKIRKQTAGTSALYFQGFEILNEVAAATYRSGATQSGGKRVVTPAANSFAYATGFESGSLATRGGRVLVYQKADGTVAKAVTPTNASQQNLTAADHTNEEGRVYSYREFGTGRIADDFADLTASTSTRAFTLDDGVTSLTGDNVNVFTAGQVRTTANTTSFITATFVGTGLDIIRQDTDTGGADTYGVTVDGVSIGNLSTTGSIVARREKIVSGLPYGTHVVRITQTSASLYNVGIRELIVYQPKRPTLPTGAVALAEYNIMADYVANSTVSLLSGGTGVLRKSPTREMVYSGTWNISAIATSTYPTAGFALNTQTNGGFIEHTFWGTGFEFRGETAAAYSATIAVTINGSAATTTNFPGATFGYYGNGSFNSGTGNYSQAVGSTTAGDGVRVSGLPLGKYTVRLTNGTGNFLVITGFDIITPIHTIALDPRFALLNCIAGVSQSVTDLRLTKALNNGSDRKFKGQTVGAAGSMSTTSTAYVPAADLIVPCRIDRDAVLEASLSVSANGNTVGASVIMAIFVNGVQSTPDFEVNTAIAGNPLDHTIIVQVPVAAGYHLVQAFWKVSSGTGQLNSTSRILGVKEL